MQLNSFWMTFWISIEDKSSTHFSIRTFSFVWYLIARVDWLLLACLKGCVYICDAYKVYWSSCVKGIHTGQMVLRLVEAIGRVLGHSLTISFLCAGSIFLLKTWFGFSFFCYIVTITCKKNELHMSWILFSCSLNNNELQPHADVYLAGTVMLIFGMGLYGLFISNVSPDEPPSVDRALQGSSLFGMFALKVN